MNFIIIIIIIIIIIMMFIKAGKWANWVGF